MTSTDDWKKANENYIDAALAWLRWRLKEFIRSTKKGIINKLIRFYLQPFRKRKAEKITQAMNDAFSATPPPQMAILKDMFNLSPFERDILLLCIAAELDSSIPSLCAQAHKNSQMNYPTFALALSLFDNSEWRILSPECPLRYWKLIETSGNGTRQLTTLPLKADERIINYVKGLFHIDERLSGILTYQENDFNQIDLSASQKVAVKAIVNQLENSEKYGSFPVIQLLGADRLSKQAIAHQAINNISNENNLNFSIFHLSIQHLPDQANELESFIRLCQRECILHHPAVLYLDIYDVDPDTTLHRHKASINSFLSRLHNSGIIFMNVHSEWPDLECRSITIEIEKPLPKEQRDAWKKFLNKKAGNNPDLIAGQFNFNIQTIKQIAKNILDLKLDDKKSSSENEPKDEESKSLFDTMLWETCRVKARPKMDELAQRIETKASFEDIVLPEMQKKMLKQIAIHARQRIKVYDDWGFRDKMNRGFGISALFTGDSGTGKTMAAEVIANELNLDLYRIDLSTVVDKYIGETEKNIRRIFDAVENGEGGSGGAILFFDEADALFGKRSEVKDSHDRYANIQINYLLQRIESYTGLAILATNMKNALDDAFLRRLRFIVEFPFPGEWERLEIWHNSFPEATPCKNLDCKKLAKFVVTGGSIHNIALGASFMAAQTKDREVTMAIVHDAIKMEFIKLGQPIKNADFKITKQNNNQ